MSYYIKNGYIYTDYFGIQGFKTYEEARLYLKHVY